jgi:hypothetical protein
VDFLLQDHDKRAVMHLVEASSYVSLDVPIDARPLLSNDSECCMATSVWPKSVAAVLEEWPVWAVVDGFENQANDLLHDFIHDTRDTQFSHLAIGFRDENRPDWLELKLFGSHGPNDFSYRFQ